MKNSKKGAMGFKGIYVTYLTFLFFAVSLFNINAQEAVLTTGGEASGDGGTVSYSVGQVVYTTNTGTSGSVLQGVQQPYEISVPTAMENTEDVILISAYPNPVKDILKLKTGQRDFNALSYRLFDMGGRLIMEEKITGSETSINMQTLSPSVYLLKVIEDDKEIKTFKIIKR